jgi:hypothetical protein
MARGTTTQERLEAVTVIPADDIPLDDIEGAFEDWRSSFDSGEEVGKLRAFQIPLDERGNVMATAKNQIRLGSWPIDLYDYDSLCAMLIRDFMPPERVLAVRLVGTQAGQRGVRFNKIVVLRAPKDAPTPGRPGGEAVDMASLMRTIQENNERMLSQFRSMQPAPAPRDSMEDLQRMMALSQMINKPMTDMMAALLPALAGRPQPAASDPFAGLSGMLDVAEKLADLRGGGTTEPGSDWLEALRAVIPLAKPALEALPSIIASRPVMPPRLALPQRAASPQPAPGSQPTPKPATVSQPAASPPAANATDIPSGDAQVFAQLKPQIDTLVQMASEQPDPQAAVAAADFLYDNMISTLPDEFYDRLYEVVGADNFVKNAAIFNPGVSQHVPWFEAFRRQVLKRYDDEEAAAISQPTEPAANA